MEQKKVYCLYRVSTLGQVEKDDIPMQKQACHEFAERQTGWRIVNELFEKGVSGFKVSAKDRDAIQEIQRDAVEKKFNVLLVFMFDRLGRRDDETPFVVEWFVQHGIEVWSAMEGQQRFDNHVDKLMNYIRYWQASGESLKTSIRVKTRQEQLTEAGFYTGGSISYGYRLVKGGRLNKKNREVFDLEVDEEEAEVVRLIFRKYVHEGFGAQRLCRYLHENHITHKDGRGFPNTSINRIIKNIDYTGVIKNGDAQSQHLPDLQIIDEDTYQRAQEIMAGRTRHHSSVPLNSKGKSLLVGNIFCAHCGNRLTLTTSGKRQVKEDGAVKYAPRIRYQCHYKVRHPGECEGQSGYSMEKLDAVVEQVIRLQFAQIKAMPEKQLLTKQHEREIEMAKAKYAIAKKQHQEKQKELDDLRRETVKVIRGESKLSIDLLNSLVEETQAAVSKLQGFMEVAKEELDTCIATSDHIRQEYARLLSWADLYDNSTFEAKKMIVSQFIKAVRVHRSYEIEVDFNVSFEEFQSYCPCDNDHGGENRIELQKSTKKAKKPGKPDFFAENGGE